MPVSRSARLRSSFPGRLARLLRPAALVAAFGLFQAGPALAVTLSGWTLSGPGATVVSGSPDAVSLSYDLAPAGYGPVTWTAEATALTSGTYTFDWSYSGFHAFFNVRAFLETTAPAITLVDAGPANCCSAPSGGFSYSGTESFYVLAGDVIGFAFGGSNFDSNNALRGTLQISTVPVPASALLMGTVLAGLLGGRLVRRRGRAV